MHLRQGRLRQGGLQLRQRALQLRELLHRAGMAVQAEPMNLMLKARWKCMTPKMYMMTG